MWCMDFTPLLHTLTSEVERPLWVLVWALLFQGFNSFDLDGSFVGLSPGCLSSQLAFGSDKMVTYLGSSFFLSLTNMTAHLRQDTPPIRPRAQDRSKRYHQT